MKKLQILYPEATREFLVDVYSACNGDIGKIKDILGPPSVNNTKTDPRREIVEALESNNETSSKRKLEHLPNAEAEDNKGAVKKPKFDIKAILNGTGKSKKKSITLHNQQEIDKYLPFVRIVKNFLSKDVADDVLKALMTQKFMFQDKEFYIAGKLCRPSQKSCTFTTPEFTAIRNQYTSNKLHNVEFFPELYTTKAFVDEKVNEILDSIPKHPIQIQDKWCSDVCIGNYFETNKSHLDWHSDKLTNIGPLPTIASVSFGATRIFRLRKIGDGGDATIYNIPLPNNTLLVMLPGTQELFKHGVPTLTNSLVQKNQISNEARFSLTFRMIQRQLYNNPVYCDKCGEGMILKRVNKTGEYIWMCFSPNKGGDCNRVLKAEFSDLHKKDGVCNFVTRSSGYVWQAPQEQDN